MTDSGKSYILEGDAVRDWWEYEYDDFEIGGEDVKEWLTTVLGPGRVEEAGRTQSKTYFGRVRLTIEVLD